MANISQIELPNGDKFNLVDKISGYVKDVEVDGTSVVDSSGVAAIDLSDYVAEDSNGDITITRDVIAGGDVEDGSGNVLSDKADLADIPGEATSSTTGTIKLNPSESIDLNASGQLTVGGRLGQFTNGGLYYPTSADPTSVGNYSLLISEGKGLSTVHRNFVVAGGSNVTLKTTAAAGATQYVVSNTSNNRYICSSFRGGRLAVSEAEAKNKTVGIVSVQFQNGGDVIPYSGGTDSSNNIIITVDESLNPSGTLSSIRGYGTWGASDIISSGQGNRSTGGKTLQVGQSLTNDGGNQVLMVGNRLYNTSNSSTLFGYDHINKVQQAFMSGQGHDSTNGVKGVTAFGTWSVIDSNTMFVIGDGSSASARHNVFEIDTNGDTKITHDLIVGEHITSAGNITDGSGNVLANKIEEGDIPGSLTYYGTCTQSGPGRDVTLGQEGYETFTLTRGVLLSVKFNYAITSSTTISVNSEKSPDSVRINYKGGALAAAGVINAGDTALLQYDGTYWEVIAVNTATSFKIVDLQISASAKIAAHSYQAATTYTVPEASRPAGMTLVGIVGYGTSNYRLQSTTHFVNGSNSIFANIANTSATEVSAGAIITFKLLYMRVQSV